MKYDADDKDSDEDDGDNGRNGSTTDRDSGDEQQERRGLQDGVIPQGMMQAWGMNNSGLWAPTTFKRTYLELPADMDYDTWEYIGVTLRDIGNATPWWIGDWLKKGHERFGEMYSQALTHTDYAYGSLANMKYVAEVFEPSRRRENLSWSIHQAVASIMRVEPTEAEKIMDLAALDGLSKEDVRAIASEWWKDRRGEGDTARAEGDSMSWDQRTEANPMLGASFSPIYVEKLERITVEFAKLNPYQFGMCRWCSIVAAEETPAVGDHEADCVWRVANELAIQNDMGGVGGV